MHPWAQNEPELMAMIYYAWDQLELQFIRNAANSMQRRAQAILDTQGGSLPRSF